MISILGMGFVTGVLGSDPDPRICFDLEAGHPDWLGKDDEVREDTDCNICVWQSGLAKKCKKGIDNTMTSIFSEEDCIVLPGWDVDKDTFVDTDCGDGMWIDVFIGRRYPKTINAMQGRRKFDKIWGLHNDQGWCLSRERGDWDEFGAGVPMRQCYWKFRLKAHSSKVSGWVASPGVYHTPIPPCNKLYIRSDKKSYINGYYSKTAHSREGKPVWQQGGKYLFFAPAPRNFWIIGVDWRGTRGWAHSVTSDIWGTWQVYTGSWVVDDSVLLECSGNGGSHSRGASLRGGLPARSGASLRGGSFANRAGGLPGGASPPPLKGASTEEGAEEGADEGRRRFSEEEMEASDCDWEDVEEQSFELGYWEDIEEQPFELLSQPIPQAAASPLERLQALESEGEAELPAEHETELPAEALPAEGETELPLDD